MESVIDTSTLISLARINYLELIPILRTDVALPEEIYEEAVSKGEEKGFADATVIKTFIERHRIKILSVKTLSIMSLRKKVNRILTKGDEAVLSLALQEKAKEIMANDDGLGRIAMALGFNVKGTPDLLMEGLRGDALSLQEFEIFVKGLVIENRLSSATGELYIVEGRKNVEGQKINKDECHA
jgi:predicted nucleic acid-binding protein